VRDWRVLQGPARDVIFRQTSEPGRMALSDFTDAAELGVTIAGAPFPHRLFHFVLAYKRLGARRGRAGRRELHRIGREPAGRALDPRRVPGEHRTDSLSAAYRNLDAATLDFKALPNVPRARVEALAAGD
jgi:hypothetical protein